MKRLLSKNSRNYFIVLGAFAAIIIIYLASLVLNSDFKKRQNTLETFEWVTNQTELNICIAYYSNHNGVGEVITNKDERYFIPMAWASSSKRHIIASYLQKGDSIINQKNTDTLYVKRNFDTKRFIMLKR